MRDEFKKLMREQVQEKLKCYADLASNEVPRKGWIRTLRDALGLSSAALAKRIGCSQANVVAMEKRERNKTISLEALEKVAQAMNCKLVYSIVPLEPINKILEKQARKIAKQQIHILNRSMALEEQALTSKQVKQQENSLVEELLRGNLKDIWG